MENIDFDGMVVGVDIGGSHITAGLVDLHKRTVVDGFFVRSAVDCHANADKILFDWANAIKKLWQHFHISSTPIGFAMPGPFDYINGICLIRGFDKYEALYGLDIRSEIAMRLGILGSNILFRNDAEAFLEGEMFCGAGGGYGNAIGLTLGTGLGSAISKNGVTTDAGLSTMKYKGEKIEEYVSTRGLLRAYERLTGRELKDAKAVADLYSTDKNAVAAFTVFKEALTWFLEQFIRQERPAIIVVAGNISNAWDLFMEDVINQLTHNMGEVPIILKSWLGEDAPLIGAAFNFFNMELLSETTNV